MHSANSWSDRPGLTITSAKKIAVRRGQSDCVIEGGFYA